MNRLATFAGLHALAATAVLMTDTTGGLGSLGTDPTVTQPAPTPAVPNTITTFEIPHLDGKRSFDAASIPGEARLELLFGAIRTYIANRVNIAYQRHIKDDKVVAWNKYDEAVKADPLQNTVAKPEGERPVLDLNAVYERAVTDLKAGSVRRNTGEGKTRERKDPLVALVTKQVVKDVFQNERLNDPKFTFPAAVKKVGTDGVAYLNALIEAKVAAGADRAPLEKMRDEKYINPAKLMLGMVDNKKLKDLPSIL